MAPSVSALGLCIGASSLKLVEVFKQDSSIRLGRNRVVSHECDTRQGVLRLLREFNPRDFDYVCITGRKFKDLVNLPKITEPEAAEAAFGYVKSAYQQHFNAILSLGSENFVVYCLNEEGAVMSVNTGNKCASGTGEFFLQQVRRMGLSPGEAAFMAHAAEPYAVSGRCSVFCKSDCTHALNKGLPRGRVCAGLGNMIAEKALEILGTLPRENIMVVGGVAHNKYVIDQIRRKVANLTVPEEADFFEALGAALYALQRQTRFQDEIEFIPHGSSFSTLPPLKDAAPLVSFHRQESAAACPNDSCILGLDVGSTTTKAVLLRITDDKMLASVYLRTNGDPIGASRECYESILRQLSGTPVKVLSLGVTGSGRYIAGLHASSEAIINEIIAHATAAAFFDPEVDTIFEIGGQDAKYTYLVNGVPCDYAMNEACSAGTGSFLEEAAKETLNISCLDIQDIALAGTAPPNFNDQCAAFISSDIKVASHENIARQDIVAGLVYSICMNYNNRVKGARKIGRRVFMQGGVCYNRAVPLAMAALLGREIIVPPDPGLMGALGVALEVKQRLRLGLLTPREFDLRALAERQVEYGKSFSCPGSSEKCDRGCQINVIKFEGKSFPFGGICNKYYNAVHHVAVETHNFDLVTQRQELLKTAGTFAGGALDKSVGLSRSFLFNSLFPLYSHFFAALGLKLLVADGVDAAGTKYVNSAFCFPVELSHGFFLNLIKKNPDYVFMPQVQELFLEDKSGDRAALRPGKNRGRLAAALPPGRQSACIVVQGEPYYLKSAFKDFKGEILSPVLNFARGWASAAPSFIRLGQMLGFSTAQSKSAFEGALARQLEFFELRKILGRQVLASVERDPQSIAVVLFGRPYNAFTAEANLGIPKKVASRGIHIVPFDCLPFEHIELNPGITWAVGQDILRCAKYVKQHKQLFGLYITNFSCGPDAFLVGYFRDIMQTKPSLTLEIDSHTADAGVTTRVEAFLDIVERYRRLNIKDAPKSAFKPARVIYKSGRALYAASDGSQCSLKDPRVRLLFPSMGQLTARLLGATFRSFGIQAQAVPIPDFKTLMLGRANASCKECLPLILVTGSLLEHVKGRADNGERTLYFMPTTNGGCRFSQYSVYLNSLIEKKRLENVALMTLSSENSYTGLGSRAALKVLRAIIVGDILDDIKNALYVLAADTQAALKIFEQEFNLIESCLQQRPAGFLRQLHFAARRLSRIPLKSSLQQSARVLMAGEIYVRRDEFSSQAVIEHLARRGIVVQRAPILEWVHYIDYWTQYVENRRLSWREKLEFKLRRMLQRRMEIQIKRALAQSGLYQYEMADIGDVLDYGRHFMDIAFGGETILVVGRFFKDILKDFHGMVSIGPFACLPSRLAESIAKPESRVRGNRRLGELKNFKELSAFANLPFLSLESDGNPFPQIIEAKIEAFCLQVERAQQKLAGTLGPAAVASAAGEKPEPHLRPAVGV